MKVGVKLFNKEGKVVLERDELPKAGAEASVLTHAGVHYSYRGLYGSNGRAENPYARFDEAQPPYELV